MNKEKNLTRNAVRGRGLNNTSSKKLKIIMLGTGVLLMCSLFLKMTENFKSNNEKEFDKRTIAMYVQNTSGEYTLSNSNTFPTAGYELNLEKSTCTNGGTLSQNSETKKIIVTISNTDSCVLYFDKEVFNVVEAVNAIKNNQKPGGINGTVSSFASAATTDEGVYQMADDYGTSYYYRGAVENNYVRFAGYYWRIIRVNGNGSIRIIYDGTQAWPNGNGADTFTTSGTDRFTHINKTYNANYNDNKYVGWMYGPAGTTVSTSKAQAQTNTTSSTIKTTVDEWYKTNIVDRGYSSAVADVIFCNDRSTPGSTVTGWSSDTGLGYGTKATAFGTIARYGWSGTTGYDNPKPQFICPNKNDAFTVSDTTKGNGALTYPVGLITGDEIVAAGSGKYNTTNRNYYLYKTSSYWYWSLSPDYVYTSGRAFMFIVGTSGSLNDNYVYYLGAVAPVINLSADYVETLRGTGTMSDPYRASDVTP